MSALDLPDKAQLAENAIMEEMDDSEKEPQEAAQGAAPVADKVVQTEAEQADDQEEEDRCHVCGEADEGDVLLLCDSCDNACHLACARPQLKRIPKGEDTHMPVCLEKGSRMAREDLLIYRYPEW